MTIALVTDTHLGARNNCTTFNTHFLRFFSEVFFPTLEERQIDTFINLGDIGKYKRTINTLILDRWNREVFKPLQKYKVWMLSGNHDLFYKHKNSISLQTSLELTDRFGFTVVSEHPVKIHLGSISLDLVPWVSSGNYQEIVHFIEKSTSDYMLCHMEFAGAIMTPGVVCSESQLDSNLTNKYKRILSGHFHLRSERGNVTYIGNPYEITWGDVNQPKGFVLFDPKSNKLEYINNPFSIFLKLFIYKESDLHSVDVSACAQKHIKLYTSSSIKSKDIENLVSRIEKQGVLSLVVQDMKMELDDVTMITTDFPDTLHYIKDFVDKLYNHQNIQLNKDRLVQKLEHIYTLAQTLEM